jgi:integral membrane protein
MIRVFRLVSIAEAASFLLLLLVAMPLKYGADAPAGVQLMGPVHGVLFMAYVGLVFLVREQLRWDLKRTILALGAAVLPVAPFFVERHWTTPADAPASATSPTPR